MSSLDITLISASAGSGKTYRLTGELLKALESGARPEGILATTFTNKAAAEITERVRLRLLENGKWDEAQRILDGYIGTVNSICGRILKDFAFDAGLSPALDVLPSGDDQLVYDRAISKVVEKYAPKLEPLAQQFQLVDWRGFVKSISDMARSNGILPQYLKSSADGSLASFSSLLPKCSIESGAAAGKWDRQLEKAIGKTLKVLEAGTDRTQATLGAIEALRQYHRKCQKKELLTWSDWAGLSGLKTGAKSRDKVSGVKEAASTHLIHPRFRSDIETFVSVTFECAAEAMEAYAVHKARHGLIDFVDQETLCLRLLQRPQVRKALAERLDLVLVDEFQDTSPIQLAIFLQLASIAPRSVWVGDQKQAIYGFRGTDSTMMDAVISDLIEPAKVDVLEHSYRSRPELVAFTSRLFAAAFEPLGIRKDRVLLKAKRTNDKSQGRALHVWHLMASNADNEVRALAVGVGDLIKDARDFTVYDRTTEKFRPLKGGDIAVLCYSNDKCSNIAAALENYGIRASVPRKGLFSQPECILAFAALRYLVSPFDSLAAAEIVHLTENGSQQGNWFPNWMESLKENEKKPWKLHACIRDLDVQRERLLRLTPSEALELALRTVNVERKALAWEDGSQRLANVEVLRELARYYEDRCQVQRRAGTPAGLVTFLSEEIAGTERDTRAEGCEEDAVQVLTYHKAKGLEWPLVILCDLQSTERANPFGVHINPSAKPFDPQNPLAGRWVRFWPWPYGGKEAVADLANAVSASKEQKMVLRSNRKEMMRLLYVGMTRARDYLILAPREKCRGVSSTAWLDALADNDGKSVLELPKEPGEKKLTVAGQSFRIVVSRLNPADRQVERKEELVYLPSYGGQKKEFPPAQLIPSQLRFMIDMEHIGVETMRLGDRTPLKGAPDMTVLGEAVHSFFAVDNIDASRENRLELAEATLKRWGTEGIEPSALLTADDRLWAYLHKAYGSNCVCRREWPVHLKIGKQRAEGWIDLLVETASGYVIVDHKSFPGALEDCCSRAKGYAPQLALYKRAIEKATARPVVDILIHMPIIGVMIRIKGI